LQLFFGLFLGCFSAFFLVRVRLDNFDTIFVLFLLRSTGRVGAFRVPRFWYFYSISGVFLEHFWCIFDAVLELFF